MPNLVVGTTTPVLIPVTDAPTRIQNLGAGIVYVDGSSAVTTATGIKVAVNETIIIDKAKSFGGLYVISDTTATNVRYLA